MNLEKREESTMGELLKDFDVKRIKSGDILKGIVIDADEKEVRIDVNIIVEYGSRIPDVAYEIQTRVKKSVENMTGLKVSEVNVHVQGVKTEKEVEEKEENEEVIEEQQ